MPIDYKGLSGRAYMSAVKRMLATTMAMTALKPDEARKVLASIDQDESRSIFLQQPFRDEDDAQDRKIIQESFDKGAGDIIDRARDQPARFDELLLKD